MGTTVADIANSYRPRSSNRIAFMARLMHIFDNKDDEYDDDEYDEYDEYDQSDYFEEFEYDNDEDC
jgi:hypothetical protein